MKDLFSERQTSIEGFYTNIEFPKSQAATRSNTPSDAVYKARKMLEQDNKLSEKINNLNKLGVSIQEGVAKYKDKSSRLLSQIKTDTTDEDKLKLSNILINRLYTTPELKDRVKTLAIGDSPENMKGVGNDNPGVPNVVWAFKQLYREIPDNEEYQVEGGLTTNNYGQQSKLKYMVKNQGKKLTFDECKELAAQQGSFIFGLTNTETVKGVYRSTCLLPSVKDFMNMGAKSHGNVKEEPRIVMIRNLGSQKLNFIVRDGEVGQTPVYSFNSAIAQQGRFTPGNETYGYPAFSFEGIYNFNPDITVGSDVSGSIKNTQLVRKGFGTIFEGARLAKANGSSYFAMVNMGNNVASQGEINSDSVSTDTSRRKGEIYIVKDLTDVKKQGSASRSTVFKYGPENTTLALEPPLYEQEYILSIQGDRANLSCAVYRTSSSENEDKMALIHKGAINVESIPFDSKSSDDTNIGSTVDVDIGVGSGILNRKVISLSEWEKMKKDPASQRVLEGWVSKSLENAATYRFPYIGFFFRYINSSSGELIAFGSPINSPSTDNTFSLKDKNGITYGNKNTVTYYMILEKGSDNSFGFPRFSTFLKGLGYVDKKKFLRGYPLAMLKPENTSETDYELLNNITSDYFNMDNVPRSELQNVSMTIPACRDLCNKYYDDCKAFVFDAAAQTVGITGVRDGTIVPKCSLKTLDPTIYSWGTEQKEYSRMYKKIPQIDNNWTCTKKVTSLPASYIVAGQQQVLGSGNYVALDDEGNTISPLKRGDKMNKNEKCGTWREYDQDAQSMRTMQEDIGANIETYVEILGELKEYNKDLIERAHINQPMVDESVTQYKEIIERINEYADSGDFRIDKYKYQMADVSRKSYTYIYILWLAIAIIVVFFAVRAIMKIKSQ